MQKKLPTCFNVKYLAYILINILLSKSLWAADAANSMPMLIDMLCGIYGIFNGAPGQIVTTFVVIIVATGAFFGKTNWQSVIVVGVCVCVYFSAEQIIGFIVGGSGHVIFVCTSRVRA